MELTQDVWWCLFVTHLAARRSTFSIVVILFAVCGSQTVAEYSKKQAVTADFNPHLHFFYKHFNTIIIYYNLN